MSDEEVLRARGVSVSFGGNRALDGVDVGVRRGEIVGMIGPNGAGKTTLFNVVTGLLAADEGTIELDGVAVDALTPHQRARRGLARTFQRLELFGELTVADNLRVAGEARNSWPGSRSSRHDVETEVRRVLSLTGLAALGDRPAASVPTGSARVVEVARALMLHPRLLLLDEPAAGQSEEETGRFELLLRGLVADGELSILLVEHDMELVMQVCDRIHVLDFGRVIAVGPPDEIRHDPNVRAAYLGVGS